MKKLSWRISGIVAILVLLGIGLTYLNLNDYLCGVKKDSVRIFNANKDYMFNLSLNGKIQKKSICKECDETHKYSIIISLNNFNPFPTIGQKQFSPYYSFISDSVITLSVTSNVFNELEIGETVTKNAADYYLNIGKKKLQILSKIKYNWLP